MTDTHVTSITQRHLEDHLQQIDTCHIYHTDTWKITYDRHTRYIYHTETLGRSPTTDRYMSHLSHRHMEDHL